MTETMQPQKSHFGGTLTCLLTPTLRHTTLFSQHSIRVDIYSVFCLEFNAYSAYSDMALTGVSAKYSESKYALIKKGLVDYSGYTFTKLCWLFFEKPFQFSTL